MLLLLGNISGACPAAIVQQNVANGGVGNNKAKVRLTFRSGRADQAEGADGHVASFGKVDKWIFQISGVGWLPQSLGESEREIESERERER